MKFKDLKLGTKIMVGFGLLSLIAITIGIVGYIGVNRVSKKSKEVIKQ